MTDIHLIIGNKRYSSWSLRGWLAARLSGLAFEETLIPLYEEGSSEKIKAFNPNAPALVPSLRVGDHAIWDTLAIAEYFAEAAPDKHLWPADPLERATARSVASEMHSGFAALRNHVPMDVRAKHPYKPMPEAVEKDIARILDIWRSCRKAHQDKGPFLFGHITLADVFYAPVLVRLESRSIPLDPVCQAYFNAMWDEPNFAEWRDEGLKESWIIENYETPD